MPYLAFILVNVVLFIRPSEIVPALIGLPIFNVAMLLALAASFPAVLGQLSPKSLVERPITVCVLGMQAAVVLADLSHQLAGRSIESGLEFIKVLLYYLLLVGVLGGLDRLRGFLFWLGMLIFALTALALAQYYGLINVPSLESYHEGEMSEDGELIGVTIRLCSTGIFNNPNALSRIVVTGMFVCGFWLDDPRSGVLRWLWLFPLATLALALMLTHSRGGLLGLMAGLAALSYARFGAKKGLLIGILALPVLLALFGGGRQTELSTNSGTAQERIHLWREGWSLFRSSPIFGIGANRYAAEVGLVAHNSFLHCYTELGFFGGTMFAGAFFLALRSLLVLGSDGAVAADPGLVRMRPHLLAIVAADVVGMLSISRTYHPPGYMILGLVTVYARLATVDRPWLAPRFDARTVRAMVAVSTIALLLLYIFINFAIH